MSDFLIDEFVAVAPGEPIRVFEVGQVFFKNGRKREMTSELLARFAVPHFKPPLKLGSHKEETPAGGHIVGLQFDGQTLFALTELNTNGTAAVSEGHYRYHSLEIIWEGGALENPDNGELIEGPLIVGLALLHTPHLGEVTAFYSTSEMDNTHRGDVTMSDTTVPVPSNVWDKVWEFFTSTNQPAQLLESDNDPKVDQLSSQLTELKAEREDLTSRLAILEDEATKRAKVDNYTLAFAPLPALRGDTELAQALAELPTERAELFSTKFKALAAQITESNLTSNLGGVSDESDDPQTAVIERAEAIAAEQKIDFVAALKQVDEGLLKQAGLKGGVS